ncbi:hypothetical protein HXX76_013611 [Chlamydomonas incerta]|uniref:Splicing factor YJU2 n=1 Tax=Chlamydomonas incerta TaxID=51695 RepID=A0A835SLA2_CHLIN|nr:hypothetical protein HXX76_013611 [Chlamydomonas incerta]|eukprot:KAG2425568.1 hypothetical protein HXX76_013611 [Chlamydomonas incerta]
MGERKVLNKYYPPDFDPAKLPRGKRRETNEMKVRMMLPMSVRCKTCGNFMYKGTKFNTRKEDVMGENYLGIQIFRFYYRCKKCSAEFCMKTDPKNADYVLEGGATRNYEPWRDEEASKADAVKAREEEEMGNAMKALENRTLDSKREMDIMAALDEMKALNAQHAKVTTEQAIAALHVAAAQQHLDDEDAEDAAAFYQLRAQAATRRLSDSEEDSAGEDGGAAGRLGPAASGRRAGGAGASGGPGPGPGLSTAAGAGASSAAGGSGLGSAAELQTLAQMQAAAEAEAGGKGASGPAAGPVAAAAPAARPVPPAPAAKPAIKVLVKPKPAAAAAAKRPAEAEAEAAGSDGAKKAKAEEAPLGLGLLGQYSSDESDS